MRDELAAQRLNCEASRRQVHRAKGGTDFFAWHDPKGLSTSLLGDGGHLRGLVAPRGGP